MITYHLSGNKVYWAVSAEEAAVFAGLMMKANALQSIHIGWECFWFPGKAQMQNFTLGSWPNNSHFFSSAPLNEILGSFEFSQVQWEWLCVAPPAYWQPVMWDRLEKASQWTMFPCLLDLCRPPLNSINSSALQEVLGGPTVTQPEILMTASSPKERREEGSAECGGLITW